MNRMGRPKTPWEVRFWSHVNKTETCWLWTGSQTSYGYGTFTKFQDIPHRAAHRYAWELTHGHPGELCVLHRCDVKLCVNPAHLFLGTKTENMRDRDQKGRQAKGERAGLAKLTDAQVREIFLEPDTTIAKVLAQRYGMGMSAIYAIRNGQTWRHITASLTK